jgi:hypothetical protein
MPSYVARVKARSGCLLGGVMVHTSSRLETFRMAVSWADIIIFNNKKAGRDPVYDGIHMEDADPEITVEDLCNED